MHPTHPLLNPPAPRRAPPEVPRHLVTVSPLTPDEELALSPRVARPLREVLGWGALLGALTALASWGLLNP
ncbi:MAG: hypothetical protein JXX28_06460 [Deltaproteobacteria bacterium]|nr:hypothetical protein [Deltaproteobacteria bacterium]